MAAKHHSVALKFDAGDNPKGIIVGQYLASMWSVNLHSPIQVTEPQVAKPNTYFAFRGASS
jgi:hypothetical protein